MSSLDELATELHELAVRENKTRKKLKANIQLSVKEHEEYIESLK